MKTDTLFYQLFKEFPGIFFELIEKPETEPNAYEFTAPEVKQRAFRLDGLFSPVKELPNKPLYFIEVQFYREEEFYDRLFPAIFLYFGQNRPLNKDWYAVVIYDRRINDTPIPPRYRELVENRLLRIYLDEIKEAAEKSIGVGIVKLVVETQNKTGKRAQQLINKARNELKDALLQQQVIELIETIVLYKFPALNRKEIEAMLGLSELKQTRVYQEAKEEAKLELVPRLQQRGLSLEEIAELLELDIETIKATIQEQSKS